jgi:hypothetical protein
MQKNAFYGYKENQASYGYRSAILYREEGQSKYRFLCASETVPFPFGTKETTDFNLMNSPIIGQVEGKDTLEQKEVELLYTRNNAILFEKLKGKVLDFMSLTPQMICYKFSGTIAFRPNDASSDLHRGTYTITPMDADPTPIYRAREEALIPLFFNTAIPDEISLSEVNNKPKINLGVTGGEATYEYDTISATTNKETGSRTTLTVTKGVAELPAVADLYVIYAIPSTTSTHSECFTTIYITE